jgi:hypothetical protein
LLRILSKIIPERQTKVFSINLAEARRGHDQSTEENFMKKNIVWLFIVAIALLAVPVSHASTVTTAGYSFDGSQPPQPPVPVPGS